VAVPDSQGHSQRSSRGSTPSTRRLRVVAIGGGTGLSTLLKGLKRYVTRLGGLEKSRPAEIRELCAVVTVSDDGGSS